MRKEHFEGSFVADLMQIVKAVALATLFSVVAVLIFALVLKFVTLTSTVIKCVDQCLKALAILLGCLLSLRGEKGWLKGAVSGILIVMLTYLIFACVGGGFSLSWLIFADLAFGGGVGVLSGIISVNIRV